MTYKPTRFGRAQVYFWLVMAALGWLAMLLSACDNPNNFVTDVPPTRTPLLYATHIPSPTLLPFVTNTPSPCGLLPTLLPRWTPDGSDCVTPQLNVVTDTATPQRCPLGACPPTPTALPTGAPLSGITPIATIVPGRDLLTPPAPFVTPVLGNSGC